MVCDAEQVVNSALSHSLRLIKRLIELIMQGPGPAPGNPGVGNPALYKPDGVVVHDGFEQCWDVNVGVATGGPTSWPSRNNLPINGNFTICGSPIINAGIPAGCSLEKLAVEPIPQLRDSACTK